MCSNQDFIRIRDVYLHLSSLPSNKYNLDTMISQLNSELEVVLNKKPSVKKEEKRFKRVYQMDSSSDEDEDVPDLSYVVNNYKQILEKQEKLDSISNKVTRISDLEPSHIKVETPNDCKEKTKGSKKKTELRKRMLLLFGDEDLIKQESTSRSSNKKRKSSIVESIPSVKVSRIDIKTATVLTTPHFSTPSDVLKTKVPSSNKAREVTVEETTNCLAEVSRRTEVFEKTELLVQKSSLVDVTNQQIASNPEESSTIPSEQMQRIEPQINTIETPIIPSEELAKDAPNTPKSTSNPTIPSTSNEDTNNPKLEKNHGVVLNPRLVDVPSKQIAPNPEKNSAMPSKYIQRIETLTNTIEIPLVPSKDSTKGVPKKPISKSKPTQPLQNSTPSVNLVIPSTQTSVSSVDTIETPLVSSNDSNKDVSKKPKPKSKQSQPLQTSRQSVNLTIPSTQRGIPPVDLTEGTSNPRPNLPILESTLLSDNQHQKVMQPPSYQQHLQAQRIADRIRKSLIQQSQLQHTTASLPNGNNLPNDPTRPQVVINVQSNIALNIYPNMMPQLAPFGPGQYTLITHEQCAAIIFTHLDKLRLWANNVLAYTHQIKTIYGTDKQDGIEDLNAFGAYVEGRVRVFGTKMYQELSRCEIAALDLPKLITYVAAKLSIPIIHVLILLFAMAKRIGDVAMSPFLLKFHKHIILINNAYNERQRAASQQQKTQPQPPTQLQDKPPELVQLNKKQQQRQEQHSRIEQLREQVPNKQQQQQTEQIQQNRLVITLNAMMQLKAQIRMYHNINSWIRKEQEKGKQASNPTRTPNQASNTAINQEVAEVDLTDSETALDCIDLTWIEDDQEDQQFKDVKSFLLKSDDCRREVVSPADSGFGGCSSPSPQIDYKCVCGKKALFVCIKCNHSTYCSHDCQNADWTNHQNVCISGQ